MGVRINDDYDEDSIPPSFGYFNELILLLKEKNIPYNIVKKYD
jgi:hypothetical protein